MKFRDFGSKNNDQGKFLKIEPDSSQVMLLRGEIAEFGLVGEGRDLKKVQSGTPGSRQRFIVNAIVSENHTFVAKVFEFGILIYRQLAQLNTEMDLEKTKMKIMRTGSGKNTDYSVIPVIKEPLSPKQLDEINKVPLHFLDVPLQDKKVEEIVNFALKDTQLKYVDHSMPSFNDFPLPESDDGVPF